MTGSARHETDKRVVRTKKAIRSALFRIMETKDISDITISELTAEANVNRRTFYTHYRNITDILTEVETDFVAALRKLADNFDPHDYEESTYKLFLEFDNLINCEFNFYFHLIHVDMRGVLMSRLKSIIKHSAESMVEYISRKRGADATILSSFISGGFFNVYIDYANSGGAISVEHAARIASKMVSICARSADEILA